VAQGLLRKALMEIAGEDTATRITGERKAVA
jgi:hypothetical protein